VKLVHFHDFKSLTITKGEAVESPEFECAGYKWKLQLYPGGSDRSSDGYVALHMWGLLPSESSKIKLRDFMINIKKSDGLNYCCEEDVEQLMMRYDVEDELVYSSRGPHGSIHDFIRRDVVLDEDLEVLHFGSLTIEVRTRFHLDNYCNDDKQPSSLSDDMLKLFLEENTEDVAFQVKGSIVKAHRTVLQAHAKELAELCESFNLSKPMQIDDVKPDIFQLMIGFIYGEMIPNEIWKEQVQYITDPTKQNQSILYAAGKYGFTALKSKAEAWCVKFLELDSDTAISHLLYADANSLMLLKNTAMNFISENSQDVIASESFSLLSESAALVTEVMKALSNQIVSLKRKYDE
jgi:hypothetical protein